MQTAWAHGQLGQMGLGRARPGSGAARLGGPPRPPARRPRPRPGRSDGARHRARRPGGSRSSSSAGRAACLVAVGHAPRSRSLAVLAAQLVQQTTRRSRTSAWRAGSCSMLLADAERTLGGDDRSARPRTSGAQAGGQRLEGPVAVERGDRAKPTPDAAAVVDVEGGQRGVSAASWWLAAWLRRSSSSSRCWSSAGSSSPAATSSSTGKRRRVGPRGLGSARHLPSSSRRRIELGQRLACGVSSGSRSMPTAKRSRAPHAAPPSTAATGGRAGRAGRPDRGRARRGPRPSPAGRRRRHANDRHEGHRLARTTTSSVLLVVGTP